MKEKIITCFASELSCVWLCDPMDSNTPGSSVHGIFQARILEWFAISYSTGSSWPRNNTQVSWVSCIGRQILYHWETWEACFEMFFLIEVSVQFSLVTQSGLTLQPQQSQHARPPCPSPAPRVYSNPCSSRWWCPTAISSSVIPFSSALNLPSIGVFSNVSSLHIRWPKYWSFSFNISPFNEHQDWSPLGWTGWISLQSKWGSRVFANTTGQKHQFFSAQLSLQSNSHIHTWPLEKP